MHLSTPITFFIVAAVCLRGCVSEKGSCRAARKCCDGKDADCMVQTAPLNSLRLEGLSEEPCYCDHGCLEVGDCCPDFKDYCGVLDCSVDEWSGWSACDVSCGIGTSVRSRKILRPESNGGAECPVLEEKKTCKATRCSKRRLEQISAIKETAMLLPGKYARQSRRAGKSYDVRQNLRSYRPQKQAQQYCAVFRVDKAMHNCQKTEETQELRRGNTVCIICDGKAQRDSLGGRCSGHGAQDKRTRFKTLLNTKCHGKWTRLELTDDCPCKNGPDFTFV